MIDNNTMNTIKAYKALSVVANVEQGEMIKRLIKENEELKKQKALMFKFQQAEVKILVDRLKEEEIYRCRCCDEMHDCCEWKEDPFDESGELPTGWFCEQCSENIDMVMSEQTSFGWVQPE